MWRGPHGCNLLFIGEYEKGIFLLGNIFFCFQHNIHNSPPPPLFFILFFVSTHQELNVGPLCFASENGKFDLAQFLISKNCPINGVHNLFVFSFFSFFFSKTLKFLFSLSFSKVSHHHSMVDHLWLLRVSTTMWILQSYYYKMEHISLFKFVGFLITFFKTILSLLSFFFFFNLPSIWFWKNRERVFFIKFVILLLLLYQLLSSWLKMEQM